MSMNCKWIFKKCGIYNNEIARCGGRKKQTITTLSSMDKCHKEMVSDPKNTYCMIPFV